MKNIEYYYHETRCGNCLEQNNLKILKGSFIQDALEKERCIKCGCNLAATKKKTWKL